MSERYRCLMLGAGAMGSRWIRDVWQPFGDRMEFAGLVDPNPSPLHEVGDWLGLPPTGRVAVWARTPPESASFGPVSAALAGLAHGEGPAAGDHAQRYAAQDMR
jgi:hypothetical protein